MPTPSARRDRGFILVALIFLVLVGALLLAAMAFLYGTATGAEATQNGGGQTFTAAESGDQYGVYYLETNYWNKLPPTPLTLPAQTPSVPDPACPPVVTVTKAGGNYFVTSVATCAGSAARWTVVRTVTATPKKGKITYTVTAWAQQ
ncbi:hypothetical protein [Acidiferrobacter sp.]|uniref:hypothetical protein n=1 Tax=Acidiferrobacter sp. TaxID=1872107 RepID=UPI00261C3E81|nr:hypothetical protein [Acidiferrobacter sp.]